MKQATALFLAGTPFILLGADDELFVMFVWSVVCAAVEALEEATWRAR